MNKLIKKNQKDIVLLRYELLQSLRVEGNLAAQTVEKDNMQGAGILRDIVDDEVNLEWVTRKIQEAVSQLWDKLFPWTKDLVQRPSRLLSDKLEDAELYQISMMVPDNVAESTLELINKLAHRYVVEYVMVEWMKRHRLADCLQLELTTLQETEAKIESAKVRRVQPIRRPMHYM